MGEPEDQIRQYRRMTKAELAERLHALQRSSSRSASDNLRESEFQAVLHELDVYQIELEMQNRELRDSRQAIEESHERYVNLYDFAPIGYVTLTDQGLIKDINLTATGMLGVERRWLLGRSLAPWVARAELATFRNHVKKCVRDQDKVTTVLHLVGKNKFSIPVELSSASASDPVTGELLIRTAITDLTERRQAEEERDRFFELSTDLLCVIRKDGHFERLNPSWETLLGFTREELYARPFLDFLHPDDRDSTLQEFQKVLRGTPMSPSFQNRYVKKDRSYVWLTWSGVVSGSAFYGVARDTTEETKTRKAIDNQYAWIKELIQSLPIPLVLAAAGNGDLISVSAEAEALLDGYSSATDIDSTQNEYYFEDLHGHRLRKSEWPRFRSTRGEVLNGEEFVWRTPLRRVHILIWSRIVPAKYEHLSIVMMMIQNIDPLKRKEEKLRATVETLRQERALRETFVSALTHDLRTPLTTAKLSAELLLRLKKDSSKVPMITGRVIKSIDRIDLMIRDLLDANRINAGEEFPLKVTCFDLGRLVNSTLEDLSHIHGPRFNVKSNGRILGNWSKQHLRRVIENLVDNAVKYGSPKALITVSVADADENHVSIVVHNFGNPIPKEEQASLFEQFRRMKSAELSGKKGWGVGLTLVRGIIKAHGGEINLVSEPDQGTTFTIILPLGVPAASPTDQLKPAR